MFSIESGIRGTKLVELLGTYCEVDYKPLNWPTGGFYFNGTRLLIRKYME